MGAPRRTDLITSRRRTHDDGEEEESFPVATDEDSLSEGSIPSDLDEDADGEGSDTSDLGTPKKLAGVNTGFKPTSFASTMADTEAMLNGIKITGDLRDVEEIHFEDMGLESDAIAAQEPSTQNEHPAGRPESLVERRRREHEEYKRKRDEDPAFVPNRGEFFMHDHRSMAPGQNGFRPPGRGRGRGRGSGGGPSHDSFSTNQPPNPANSAWAHDLHDTVTELESAKNDASKTNAMAAPRAPVNSSISTSVNPPPNRSFSRTTRVGNVQLRVFLFGMKDPIIFSAVPVNQHTRLPHHRPPLRRDKPVRISLPDLPPRYIFPAVDRSFIFIPRALRPNQQGFGRGRGRAGFGGYGSFASGRTSVYGGSNYSPSVAMSRRSSLVREVTRDGVTSPAGSVVSRSQPVVRLPPAADTGPFQHAQVQQPPYAGSPVPVVNLPQPQAYPAVQSHQALENWSSGLPMHQPRPQKSVSVADIESPATLNFPLPPPQQQQQPFHNQVPHTVATAYPVDPTMYGHSRRASHQSQRGTPLSQIPERAVHAQSFQPYQYPQAQVFYPSAYPTPMFYYAHPGPPVVASVPGQGFVGEQQYPYLVSAPPPAAGPDGPQPGTVAHESNGMVYYYDSSQLTAGGENVAVYPPVAYGPPSDGYMLPQQTVYYPPQ